MKMSAIQFLKLTAGFNIHKFMVVLKLHLYALHGSWNKQRFLPYTILNT